jgi:hypothetical protein
MTQGSGLISIHGYLQDLYGSNSTARSISAVGLPRNKDGVSTRLATIFWNIINNP